ncbi:MAG: hypothetical protein COA50_04510 [Flavobacteriaceae bacterium]|nr:MAG: hypothetical protein COA50_04510 [Flavobacteriaceae bacterium]
MIVKLIFRILILGSIILLLSYSALYLNPDYKNEYVAAIVPKLEKLKSIKGPKLVIIGGSNASFGIDTNLMEKELGIPVVNMSLHGGLPLKYIFEQVKLDLNKGDVLILAKEYSGFKNQYWNKMTGIELPKIVTYELSQLRVLLRNRKLFESTVNGVFKTIKYYVSEYPIEGKKGTKSVYSLDAFNGDNLKSEFIIGKYEKEVKEHDLPKLRKKSVVINGLREYKSYFDKKGIQFYLTPPVIIDGYYRNKEILPFWKFLSEATEIPMLSMDKKYTYDKKYFFNSHYHPNVVGRKIRTTSLINDITNKQLLAVRKKESKVVYIAKKTTLNKASLDMFNKMLNYKIIKRDTNGILIGQKGELRQNYFRMRFENKNYIGHNFYLYLEGNEQVIKNIRFRGIGKLENFDTIISLGDNKYKLWKKVSEVFYKDNNSYLGISFPENKELLGIEFTIKDVGLYEHLWDKNLYLEEYSLSIEEGKMLYFEIISDTNKIGLKDMVEGNVMNDNIELNTNSLYQIIKKNGATHFIDFYDGSTIYKTTNNITIKSSSNNVIRIFE